MDIVYELSIIIPTLNESEALPELLDGLALQQDIRLEVIVSDGGSVDGTRAIAESKAAKVLEVPRGRAVQLNVGAQAAKYDNLLFLHADSLLDDPRILRSALEDWTQHKSRLNRDNVAGHFALKFDRDTSDNEASFRYMEEKTATGRLHTINGDQGCLISKEYFNELGGYDESMTFMEDQVLAQKVFETGDWYLLPGQIVTSRRRFQVEGLYRRYILLSLMMGLFWTDNKQFFNHAIDVYKDQENASKLKLTPYFRAVWQMLIHDLGFWGSVKGLYRVGRYVRQNSWQMFFFFDVRFRKLLGSGRYPFTWFHDKVVHPLTNNFVFDSIVTVLVVSWFLGCLGPYFYITEKLDGLFKTRPSRLESTALSCKEER